MFVELRKVKVGGLIFGNVKIKKKQLKVLAPLISVVIKRKTGISLPVFPALLRGMEDFRTALVQYSCYSKFGFVRSW